MVPRPARAEIHVGVEEPFAPARKAHPRVSPSTTWRSSPTGSSGLGFEVDWRERHTFPGFERFHTHDAHGNRVEVLG